MCRLRRESRRLDCLAHLFVQLQSVRPKWTCKHSKQLKLTVSLSILMLTRHYINSDISSIITTVKGTLRMQPLGISANLKKNVFIS